jgi:hypothetical protein
MIIGPSEQSSFRQLLETAEIQPAHGLREGLYPMGTRNTQ